MSILIGVGVALNHATALEDQPHGAGLNEHPLEILYAEYIALKD